MTMPKGYGSNDEFGSRFDPNSLRRKQDKYEARHKQVKIKFVKSKYCDDCGHLKIVHEGFFTKGKCNVCMCPRFKDKMIRVQK